MILSQLLATQSPVTAEHGLAVAGHELEAEAGVRILQQGGNAIDALLASAFVGYVVEPSNCGVGGYARLSIYWAERNEFISIDSYVRAPSKATPDMFEIDPSIPPTYYGHPHTKGGLGQKGYLACAVPGAVAGMCTAHEMFGRLPLSQVLEPAIEIAEAGLPVSWRIMLSIADQMADLQRFPDLAALLLPNGRPAKAHSIWTQGQRLDYSALAQTLKRIAKEGAAGFHTGPVAEAIEKFVVGHGGLLTAADLANFRPKIMREKPARYRGYDYISCYDQVSYEALNILDQFDLRAYGPDSVEFRHLMAEAIGCAFSDSMWHYGDPDFTRSPVNGLASRAFAATRAAGIKLDRALPRPIAAGDPWPYEDVMQAPERLPNKPSYGGSLGTSQMVAADAAGNLAVTCTSLSGGFGSMVYVPEVGVLLNNSMCNFDPRPEQPNSIAPGKMPIFAAPVIALTENGQPRFAAAGSGGYRIETGVLHTLVHHLDFDLPIQAAHDAPRVHCQGEETVVDNRIPAEVQAQLAAMGHKVEPVSITEHLGAYPFARVCAIAVDPKTKLMHAGAGSPWGTAAAGY
jgi:gamma-glutamyltranspeptidase/glutathione hydrolase